MVSHNDECDSTVDGQSFAKGGLRSSGGEFRKISKSVGAVDGCGKLACEVAGIEPDRIFRSEVEIVTNIGADVRQRRGSE